MNQSDWFKGKIAIITGSSSGIGATTARLFTKHGCAVSLTGRDEKRLQEVKRACIGHGLNENNVIYHVGDVTSDKFLQHLVDGTIEKFGKLDILVNCAGFYLPGLINECPIEKFDEIIGTNVRSIVQLTKLCIPHLIKSKGTVVNVSSIAGIKPSLLNPYHCMSKAALDHFTKCLALDLAPHGVRVNSVNPGLTKTPGLMDLVNTSIPEEAEKELSKWADGIPMKRIGQADEIAQVIAFLASNQSSFITGQLLLVDGGSHL